MYAIAAVNGTQIFDVSGLDIHLATISISAQSYPSAGTVTIETQLVGSVIWSVVAMNAPLANDVFRQIEGDIAKVRLTISGIVGGQGLSLQLVENQGFPFRAFEGQRALTVQNYIEANAKNGTQFEASSYIAALGVGASIDSVFVTGSKPIAIKSSQLNTDASDLVVTTYKNPTYTGGAAVAVYNLSDINPVATTVQVLAGVTTTDVGTQIAPTFNIIGADASGGIGNPVHSPTFAVPGNERILAPNTTYMRRITNNSDTAAKVSLYLTWYEGELDLPID